MIAFAVVRDTFLNRDFYTGALEEQDTYRRVYEEVLADPELASLVNDLFGNVDVERSAVVSTLRLVLPPDHLKTAVEALIERFITYVRGDSDRLETLLDLASALENQDDALATYLAQQIALIDSDPHGSAENLVDQVKQLADSMAKGELPDTIPDAPIPPEDIQAVSDAILSHVSSPVAGDLRLPIELALSANDLRGALALVSPELYSDLLVEAGLSLQESLDANSSLNIVRVLEDITGFTEDQVLADLNTARDRLSPLSSTWVGISTLVLTLTLLFALLRLQRGTRQDVVKRLAFMTAVTGAILLSVSIFVGSKLTREALGNPIRKAFGSDGEEGVLQLEVLLTDIAGSLGDRIVNSLSGYAILLLLLAIVLLGASYLPGNTERLRIRTWEQLVRVNVVLVGAVGTFAVLGFFLVVPLVTGASSPQTCNGYAELCERRYDEVTFPATHNSMSASTLGWALPDHDRTISQQLQDGIRVLLIDTHYWDDADDVAETIAENIQIPNSLIPAIERLTRSFAAAPEGTFLCHASCWLGATILTDALTGVREFMEENPSEVVTLIIEDGVTPEDTVAAFSESGLADLAYSHDPDEEWPTLEKMIGSGKRLVVMVERAQSQPDWYHYMWDFASDTDFAVRGLNEFDCVPNRGESSSDLLLMNNWVVRLAPDRADSALINASDFLVARAEECRAVQGKLPNFIAVNFHTQGDLFGAVDRLNGVAP